MRGSVSDENDFEISLGTHAPVEELTEIQQQVGTYRATADESIHMQK